MRWRGFICNLLADRAGANKFGDILAHDVPRQIFLDKEAVSALASVVSDNAIMHIMQIGLNDRGR